MPLACPVNNTHPAAPDFLQDLIVPYAPIGVTYLKFPEHIVQRFGLLSISSYTLGEQASQAKTASDARSRSTLWTECRFLLEIRGNAGPCHRSSES
jgi:hypothetical protein